MEHFINIIYKENADSHGIAECIASGSNILTESSIDFYTGELNTNEKIITMALPEAVKGIDSVAQDIAMRLFEFGLKEFDIEITEDETIARTLRRGMRGEDVKRIQRELGMPASEQDGIFGRKTERAVRTFQQNAGIQVDGVVGQQTQSAILKYRKPGTGVSVQKPGPAYIDAPYPKQSKRDVGGTPAKPKEVTRLLVGQLNDYVFDYSYRLYVKHRKTHEVARISDYGNRDNPLILIPRMPMRGQPPTNPKGPLYSNQGIRLDQPKDKNPDADFIGRARDAIDSAVDNRLTGVAYDTKQEDTGMQKDESVAPRPKGAFMFRERNEWNSQYRNTHNIDGTPKQLTESIEDYEVTYEDVDQFHEDYGILWYNEDEIVDEAEYQGRKVKLGKPMKGDVKKFKVYVKNPKGNVVKVNFGQKGVKIKKSNPGRRKSFRARHNCDNPGPRHKARYWSCRKW